MSEGQLDPDKALIALGKYGKYQIRIWIISSLPPFYMAMQMLSMAFVNGKPDFYCTSEEENNANWNWSGSKPNDTCFVTRINSNNSTSVSPCGTGGSRFVYDKDFGSTIVTEWNLVCERFFYSELVSSMFMFGVMIGAMSITHLSDRFGRRWVFLICSWLFAVVSLGLAFTRNYITFALGVGMVGFVISCEVIPASWRGYSTLLGCVTWCIGFVTLGILAMFIRDWRWLTIVTSLPSFISLIYYWFLPETLRWLIVNGKEAEAETWIQTAAKYNQITVHMDKLKVEKTNEIEIKKQHLFTICTSKILTIQAIVMCYLWLCNAFVYYGLSLFSTQLSGDRYLNFILSGLVELPAYFVAVFSLEKCGRRATAFVFHIIAGIALFLLIFIPPKTESGINLSPLILILSLTGKFSISCTFQVIFLYAAELYPTTIRTVGCGLSSTAARIGAILAPHVGLLAELNRSLPPAIFGIMSLLAAAFVGCLPETKGTELCNDIKDVRAGPLQRIIFGIPISKHNVNNRRSLETKATSKEIQALSNG